MLYTTHHYSNNFCKDLRAACLKDIETGLSFNLVALPGAGITFFLKSLSQSDSENYIFINSYEMAQFSRDTFYSQIASKIGVKSQSKSLEDISRKLVEKSNELGRLILVFNRIDRLNEIIDQNFFDNLRFLRDINRNKINMIFVSSTPIIETYGHQIKDLLSLITKTEYFKGYTSKDIKEVYTSIDNQKIDNRALKMSGGHLLLLQVLMRCQNLDRPLSDPMVELVVKDLCNNLTVRHKKILSGNRTRYNLPNDDYLFNQGFLKVQKNNEIIIFSPLLEEYINSQNKQHLPVKEKRLLKILMQNKDKIVLKDTICDYVWSENNGIASDWALNSLIYRLRKHAAFDNSNYTIESRKGEGYILYHN